MSVTSPKKKRLAFGLIGLLILAVLGNVLWHFQELWLPYWLPATEEAGPAAAGDTPDAAVTEPAVPGTPVPAAPVEAPLEFLSAAAWDHPQFRQGVRLFNQALDRYRLSQSEGNNPALLAQAAEGTRKAGRLFQSLQPEAPSPAITDNAVARCVRLMEAVQESRAAAARARTEPAPRTRIGDPLKNPDYLEGARLFNKALAQFEQYKADTSRKDLLNPTEDLARQAAQKFEALKRQVPMEDGDKLDRLIHQCYGIVTACRQQQLEAEGSGSTKNDVFDRTTAGPGRRPALPAYQPVP